MKLASYKDGSRDGQLVVVSRDLGSAHYATGIATRLQQVLDDWNFMSPQLEALSQTLNHGKARHAFPFDPRLCMAPLPRAHAWAEAWAPASETDADGAPAAPSDDGASAAASARTAPALRRPPPPRPDRADAFLGPRGPLRPPPAGQGGGPRTAAEATPPQAWALAPSPGLVAMGADLGAGLGADALVDGVRLLTMACGLTLHTGVAGPGDEGAAVDGDPGHRRGHGPDAMARRLAVAMAPVAVTPDELGAAWARGRAALELVWQRNGRAAGRWQAGAAPWHVGEWLASWTAHRPLRSGWALAWGDTNAGTAVSRPGAPGDLLVAGDTLHLTAQDHDGNAPFGRIELTLPDAE